ncbi:hypothetical protein BASA81_000865 [Batrachochytrium salamandrivorans]|nr:hypothetical protein BASA81_000865 [Batrachochytrium salamandrivorans]
MDTELETLIAEPLKRIRRISTDELADNPTPQIHSTQVSAGDRLVIIMVGLPARGKTYISQKVCQYLTFFHGRDCKVFNLGLMRRSRVGAKAPAWFFDSNNLEATHIRQQLAEECVGELKSWVEEGEGRIGIYDATNPSALGRKRLYEQLLGLVQSKSQILFIESVVNDDLLVERNIRQVKLTSPDYEGMPAADAVKDFKSRIDKYRQVYQGLGVGSAHEEQAWSWARVEDGGRLVAMNRIHGYLQGRICHLLSSLHTSFPPIYLVRNGESEYEAQTRNGGDSQLTQTGRQFAERFARFVQTSVTITTSTGKEEDPVAIFTSSLVADKQTCSSVGLPIQPRVFRNLDQRFLGRLDGLTDGEMVSLLPEEMSDLARDPLCYRFPRGESYLDLIDRIEPVVLEIQRQHGPPYG